MLKFTLALGFLLFSILSFSQEDAIYTITFESNWSQAMHPHSSGSLPAGAHWTRLVGATHNNGVTFVEMGGLATPGIKDLAELGVNTVFFNEINAAITAGTANQSINGSDLGTAGGTITINDLIVNEDFTLLSLASMIAPSPDWMIAINSIDLQDGSGDWKDEIIIDLFPYDAGTDSGVDYTSPNMNTSPQDPISSLQGMVPFSSEIIGTITISFEGVLNVLDQTKEVFNMNPNPAIDIVTLHGINEAFTQVILYNTIGRRIKEFQNVNTSNLTIDLSDLSSGLYLVKVTDTKGNSTVKKLIKR